MSAAQITIPVGRLVSGNPETSEQKKDDKTKALKFKADGTPDVQTYFAVAIAKEPGHTHWNQTAWGAQIWAAGQAASPQIHAAPHFAWKIVDGDSTVPNKAMKLPKDQPGHAGHWVIKFTSGFIPNRYRKNTAGTIEQILTTGIFKPGHFVQVQLNVTGNGSTESPGVYLNPRMVFWAAFGEEFAMGPDPESAGFGAAPLPAGASMVPVGVSALPTGAPPPPGAPVAPPAPPAPPMQVPGQAIAPQLVQVPGAPHTIEACRAGGWTDEQLIAGGIAMRAAPLPPVISAPAPVASAAPTAPVIPNPAFAAVPPPAAIAPPPAAVAPPPPAAPAGPQLTPAGVQAGGTYAGFLSQGWNDAQMRAAGYLV